MFIDFSTRILENIIKKYIFLLLVLKQKYFTFFATLPYSLIN